MQRLKRVLEWLFLPQEAGVAEEQGESSEAREASEVVPNSRMEAGEVPTAEVTPESHVLIECNAGKMYFPRYALSDGELETVAKAVKLVMGILYRETDSTGREQNLFSPGRDYQIPVEEYLTRHPAVHNKELCVYEIRNGNLMSNSIVLSVRNPRALMKMGGNLPFLFILVSMASIAKAGDVDYLTPLSKGMPGRTAPNAPWKPVTFEVWHWKRSSSYGSEFRMSGHAATTLGRMGFKLQHGSRVPDRLIVPVWYHQDCELPATRKHYARTGEDAARDYLDIWMHPRGVRAHSAGDWAEVGGCWSESHAPACFPAQEQCLFISQDGTVTLGPPEDAELWRTYGVDGYAIHLEGGWAGPSDYDGSPVGYGTPKPAPYVFHRLALEEFLYNNHEEKGFLHRAVYAPDGEVKLAEKYPLVEHLCRMFPCLRCGKNRRTIGSCEGGHREYYCEHCVVKSGIFPRRSFCSDTCAERARARSEEAEREDGFLKL